MLNVIAGLGEFLGGAGGNQLAGLVTEHGDGVGGRLDALTEDGTPDAGGVCMNNSGGTEGATIVVVGDEGLQ